MLVKTIRLTDKGQITLPVEALRAMNAGKGTEFLLIQEGERMVIVKASAVGKALLEEFGGWEALAAPAFADLWDNDEDEVWDHV
ncbi:MAG TPA: AbrB/MazE/SpoVT family DNA-binding domain-containing protein [Candidatus Thermoplasmatota archaeon]|nr:AbrB/MazE/SpoVT family DNA-binding domain-containing protein [Candidatus Thermoplasmatota archaeon]